MNVCVCVHVSDGRGERGRDLLLEKLREKGGKKINQLSHSFLYILIEKD